MESDPDFFCRCLIRSATPTNPVVFLPLFRLAFRPFFLGAALFSLIALSLWGSFWLNGMSWTPYGGWLWWHAHEMLFGFVGAVIVGFLLTAVQNWTAQDSINGWPLAALFCLWLLARLLLLYPIAAIESILPWLDLAFLPVVAWVMGKLVLWRVRQYQNLVFVPVLLLLATSNAQMHWAVATGDAVSLYKQAAHSGIFLIVLIMVVLGGRVIPFFTANATATIKTNPHPWIEIPSIASVAVLALLQLFGLITLLPTLIVSGLFFDRGAGQPAALAELAPLDHIQSTSVMVLTRRLPVHRAGICALRIAFRRFDASLV